MLGSTEHRADCATLAPLGLAAYGAFTVKKQLGLDLWIMPPVQGLSFGKTSKEDISDKGNIVPERSGQDTGSPEGRGSVLKCWDNSQESTVFLLRMSLKGWRDG